MILEEKRVFQRLEQSIRERLINMIFKNFPIRGTWMAQSGV